MPQERLQKVLAAAGVASRRASEKLIAAGRVQVDGRTVTEMGVKVDPTYAHITVDGKPIRPVTKHTYFKLYKPRGVISDFGGDAEGRRNVADLLPDDAPRVFPVGRLDYNSEGLMLLTDNGDLAYKLTHPRYEHPKTYLVLVYQRPTEAALHQLRTGVQLPDYRTAPAKARVIERLPKGLQLDTGPAKGVWLEIILREGKKRQIRHMTAEVGYPTLRLVRWAIGPVTMSNVAPSQVMPLNKQELFELRRLAGMSTPKSRVKK